MPTANSPVYFEVSFRRGADQFDPADVAEHQPRLHRKLLHLFHALEARINAHDVSRAGIIKIADRHRLVVGLEASNEGPNIDAIRD